MIYKEIEIQFKNEIKMQIDLDLSETNGISQFKIYVGTKPNVRPINYINTTKANKQLLLKLLNNYVKSLKNVSFIAEY